MQTLTELNEKSILVSLHDNPKAAYNSDMKNMIVLASPRPCLLVIPMKKKKTTVFFESLGSLAIPF